MFNRLELVDLAVLGAIAFMQPACAQSTLGDTTVRVVIPTARNSKEPGTILDLGYIEMSGDIRQAAVSRLAEALLPAQRTAGSFTNSGEPIVRVLVNSQGSEVLAAIQMGQIIRSQAAEV